MVYFLLKCLCFFLPIFGVVSVLRGPTDLTWRFDNDTLYWANVKPFVWTKKLAQTFENGVFLAMNEFCAGEHGGTHLDAPYHFNEKGLKVGQIPFENLIAPGIVVDISEEVEKNGPSTNLEVRHLENWENENGELPEKTILLVRTGWSKYWPNKRAYFGITGNDNTSFHFPGVSEDAAKWIAVRKNILGVGADVASIDAGQSQTYPAHRILSAKGLYLMENVNIKKELPSKGFTLFVMPMKIMYGTGAPLRIFATPEIVWDKIEKI